jgi:uncharacterized zinc-type alcohol dehydrogenase-like protein
MTDCIGYAAKDVSAPLSPFSFHRRDLGSEDVQIDILYCGVCHSDLHRIDNDWNNTIYPLVPGHEIVGKVASIGEKVKRYKVGDLIGVGTIIDSCQQCQSCKRGEENYCEEGPTSTYNAKDKKTGEVTRGGYANTIVVTEKFVYAVPKSLDPAGVAPLLCAGITTYSSLKHWNVQKGQKVGIVGIGGLGHIALKIAHAMGAHVVAITTTLEKTQEALRLGAQEVLLSTDAQAMQSHAATFDFILSTVPTTHDINPYIQLLKTNATLTVVGALGTVATGINGRELATRRRSIAGSYIGGVAETQEMLAFCAKHNITSDIELIKIQDINEALERMKKGDVRYRFVIDMESLKR